MPEVSASTQTPPGTLLRRSISGEVLVMIAPHGRMEDVIIVTMFKHGDYRPQWLFYPWQLRRIEDDDART